MQNPNIFLVCAFMPLPTFTTQRLILREVTLGDIPAYKKHFVNYEVIKHLAATVPWPFPDDGVESFLQQKVIPNQGNDRWVWGLYRKIQPDELIGAVDLWREGKPQHRGFWLGEAYWGQGFMTEAVAPITEYAFTQLCFEELVFDNAKGNRGSRRIKEKTGATYLRTEPASFVAPSYSEREVWLLTKAAWQKHR
jgi:RimJ/RimL family protein N-acetyltransferase